MDTTSIESSLASKIRKKRKYAACNNDANNLISSGESSLPDDNSDRNENLLDLTARKDFGHEECSVLVDMLTPNSGRNYSVTELLMSKIGIGPKGGVQIAKLLSTNHSIVHLDLERNGLGTIGACAIFRALATNNTLRKLNMSLNDIKAATNSGNEEAHKALGDALRQNSMLSELILIRSGLGPKGGANLAHGLTCNNFLNVLDLEGNDIMADGGEEIGKALKVNNTLQKLNLRWNRIGCGGDRGILSLADSLRVNIGLHELDMSVNELYCEGAVAFAKGLEANHSLIDLSLERNEIGVAGAVAIGKALKVNKTLRRLVLSGNPMIGDDGAASIGQSLAENDHSAITSIEMVGCGVGKMGASAFGRALKCSGISLTDLRLEKNRIGPEGAVAIADGLGDNSSLKHLNLSRNGIQKVGGAALSLALTKNKTLCSLDISNNDIEVDNTCKEERSLGVDSHIIESIVDHPNLVDVNVSSNALKIIPIDCQLKLARIYKSGREINIDLTDNPLSSPPLGRRASVEGLKAYLHMLLSDSTAVNCIRLMVLGFGGVGKSTFCDAVTQPKDSLQYFHGSLMPLENWDVHMIASWARRLGTHWAPYIGSILESSKISGKDLQNLIVVSKSKGEDGTVIDESENFEPSKILSDLLDNSEVNGTAMNPSERTSFARAIGSLMRKGYFSTVGAVKLEGLFELNQTSGDDHNSHSSPKRTCTLVDFAGQMEYLVSHQLLLSSLHTLCVILQPAPSFGNIQNRHYGSWMYWSRFLRALGDRRRGSLLLAISQQDKVASSSINSVNSAIKDELSAIRSSISNITESPPICLDYRPEFIQSTVEGVRKALSEAADVVAKDWWVPTSYETLAKLVRRMEEENKRKREIPIISRDQLHRELPSVGLHQMHKDPQLFQRGIEYLEAVGDVMTDDRLDCLLLDPISWFASFLAHFIRDEDIVTSVQLESRFVQRGVVGLEDVVAALQHDYAKPREQVAEIMSLVCRLELCIQYNGSHYGNTDTSDCKMGANETPSDNQNIDAATEVSYLFPCLLPPVTASELAKYWPGTHESGHNEHSDPWVYRGYRFRSRNGFFPPGLFPGLLARCRLLRTGVLSSERMWKNCAVLHFGNRCKVLLRIDLSSDCGENNGAVLDVVGTAATSEQLFVGGAKGQASVVIWMTHLIKMFLRKSYPQLKIDEFFLCPSSECHGIPTLCKTTEKTFQPCRSCYYGVEFPAVPVSGKRYNGDHSCEAEGCWSQLGTGHKIERMKPKETTKDALFCTPCQIEARFALRT